MTTITIEAGQLMAAAVDTETREIPFRALTFGEIGRTNLGRISVPKGAFTLPADLDVLGVNLEHEQTMPVGRVLTAAESDVELGGRLRIARTPEGDQLLAAYARKDPDAPRSVSVEVRDVVLRAGRAIAGTITGLAIVKAGAFPSATLMAADVGDEVADAADEARTTTAHDETTFVDEAGVTWRRVEDVETTVEGATTTTTTTVVEETEEPDEEPDDTEEEDVVTVATAPSTLTARRAKTGTSGPTDEARKGLSFQQMMRGLAAVKSGHASPQLLASLAAEAGPARNALFAALVDVPYVGADAPGTVMNPNPQWIGELWDGLAYVRDVVEVLTTAPLTALKIAGWKWDVKPGGRGYLGNKRAIPSLPAKVVAAEEEADGWAGGNDHDIRYRHFPNPEYWESYYKAMREAYAIWSNEKAFRKLVGTAPSTTPDAVPAGLSAGLSYLVDGVAEVIDSKAIPTFAFVETALYKGILKTTNNNVLGYLDAAIGLEEGTLGAAGFKLKPRSTYSDFDFAGAAPNEVETRTEHPFTGVLVGARQAATFHELPGVPVRVEAEDIARGGIDTGLFGYCATVVHKADALIHIGAAPLIEEEGE
jgi:hypothetical protein